MFHVVGVPIFRTILIIFTEDLKSGMHLWSDRIYTLKNVGVNDISVGYKMFEKFTSA